MASPLNLTTSNIDQISKNDSYRVLKGSQVKSIFRNTIFSPYPQTVDEKGNVTKIVTGSKLNNDDINDVSISSLVEYTKDKPAMRLSYADFAYLKNVGVFPNNRLVIVRRFAGGVGNNLIALKSKPIATIISWIKEDENFASLKFNEAWVDADASFRDVLNSIGKDLTSGDSDNGTNWGDKLGAGGGVIPLPGFMEGLVYDVMKNMGITDNGSGEPPLGNPNIVREAKRRSVVDPEKPGSGVKASFSFNVVAEYEQKYIDGLDPSLVYLDILQNALTFGTSKANFQFNNDFNSGVKGIIGKLISGDVKAIGEALLSFVSSLTKALYTTGKQLIDAMINPKPKNTEDPTAGLTVDGVLDAISEVFKRTAGHVIAKYKVRLIGIANALTGTPSTPWHITIGNPKKPIFSSGDMLCTEVNIVFGNTLAYNDLPSSIRIEFKIENARNLGGQEIFERLNTGRGRSYIKLNKSYVESPDGLISPKNKTNPNNRNVTNRTIAGNQEIESSSDPNDPNNYGTDEDFVNSPKYS